MTSQDALTAEEAKTLSNAREVLTMPMSNPRTKATCKHGNEISLLPSFNYVRCAKCDAEADAENAARQTPTATPPTTAQGMTDEDIRERFQFLRRNIGDWTESDAAEVCDFALSALQTISTQAATIAVLVEAGAPLLDVCRALGFVDEDVLDKYTAALADLPASAKALTDELERLRAKVVELENK